MSPLLASAIVLLTIVVGLVLMRRRAQSQPRAGGPSPGSPAQPPSNRTPSTDPAKLVDPVLGPLHYDGERGWSHDDNFAFAGTTLFLELAGGPSGPDIDARGYVSAALAQQADLDGRARALIVEEARSSGLAATVLEPCELRVGPDAEDAMRGYLWYEIDDGEAEIGVSSVDLWRTLTIETLT